MLKAEKQAIICTLYTQHTPLQPFPTSHPHPCLHRTRTSEREGSYSTSQKQNKNRKKEQKEKKKKKPALFQETVVTRQGEQKPYGIK